MRIDVLDEVSGIAGVIAEEIVLTDEQSALDLMATVRYETGFDKIVIAKEAIDEPFFDLSTRIAGGILQKYVNYGVKMAIVGDFSGYTSKSLKDFIYESNNGKYFFFVKSREEAVERLRAV